MAEPQNLANAVLIIGAAYLWGIGLMGWIPCFLLSAAGAATWSSWYQTDDQKKLVRITIEEIEARTQNIKMATAVATANLKIIMRNL